MYVPDTPRSDKIENPFEDPRAKEVPKGMASNVKPRAADKALAGHGCHEGGGAI